MHAAHVARRPILVHRECVAAREVTRGRAANALTMPRQWLSRQAFRFCAMPMP
jgi:hypothetical protein